MATQKITQHNIKKKDRLPMQSSKKRKTEKEKEEEEKNLKGNK